MLTNSVGIVKYRLPYSTKPVGLGTIGYGFAVP